MKLLRLGAAAAFLILVPASPALGVEDSTAVCHATWHLRFSPGVGTTWQRSAFTTDGETGTITCVGRVEGHDVRGPGTFEDRGVLEGTVLLGSVSFVKTYTIPTSAGPVRLTFHGTVAYGPGIGLKSGDSLMVPLHFFPTVGNGVTAPVTELFLISEGVLRT